MGHAWWLWQRQHVRVNGSLRGWGTKERKGQGAPSLQGSSLANEGLTKELSFPNSATWKSSPLWHGLLCVLGEGRHSASKLPEPHRR